MFSRSILLGLLILLAQSASAQQNFSEVGMFFVGGELVDGEMRGQGLVHFIKPEQVTQPNPVIFYPGLGLSSSIWLATPDGREGWAQRFARAGYEVYVYDAVNTGMSGIDIGPFQSGAAPVDQLAEWEPESVWTFFGVGTGIGEPHEGAQFPYQAMDQMLMSLATRVGGQPGRGSNLGNSEGGGSPNTRNILEIIQKAGSPAILIGHSFAGRTYYPLGASQPDRVAAVVALEADGCITREDELGGFADEVPYLTLYGDYLDTRAQTGRRDGCQQMADLIAQAGGTGELWNLPEMGIRGNSHQLMQDRNSHQLAQMVMQWLEQKDETAVTGLPE